MSYKFEQIIILGSGSLAERCVSHLMQFGIPLTLYETNTTNLTTLKNVADSHNIKYFSIEKGEIFASLTAVRSKTLVICISCNYIIPVNVIDNKFLLIINYHNALLPKHPGRNAEAWAIYEQDKSTGITWHLVDERVDTGDIIIQREISIDPSISSISLLRLQSQLAFDSFKAITNDLLHGNISCFKQNLELRGKLHLSSEVPNNGFLDYTWDIDKMKAFLKAMDYGPIYTLGRPKIILNDIIYMWKKALFYDIDTGPDGIYLNDEERYVVIVKSGKAVKLIDILK